MLIAVESGRLELETSAEAAWVRRGADGTRAALSEATLTAGDGALLTADTEGPATARAAPAERTTLRNDSDAPLVVLILTIGPAAKTSGEAPSAPAPATPVQPSGGLRDEAVAALPAGHAQDTTDRRSRR